jgi:hypothetical protein
LAEDRYSAYEKKPQRRDWLAVLAMVFAVAGGAAYFWKHSHNVPIDELLRFTSLYVACPLSLAVICMFGWLRYTK